MARKVGNIVFNKEGQYLPLYPVWGSTFSTKIKVEKDGKTLFKKGQKYLICGMSNGVWTKDGRDKWWEIQVEGDFSSPKFFVKVKDIEKLYDKGLLL